MLLVSSPSYEERVGAILVGKRHLFTHVVGEDATEDVVGLSKRTMELALEALEPSPPASAELTEDASPEAPPAVEALGEAAPPPSASPTSAPISTPSSAWAPEMARAIEALQVALGTRLERLLVASAGLLALVDRVDDALRSEATAAADPISVTVLDTATWHALRRFAGETAFAGAQEAYARPDEVPAPADPLLALAHRKLDAAGVLRERGCVADALECLTAAVLAELARRAGERVAPPAAEAAAWLFGSAVPGGQVAVEDAHLALRLQALSLARSVPEALVEAAFGDVSRLIPTLPT